MAYGLKDVSLERREQLNQGAASKNLMEQLLVDQPKLAQLILVNLATSFPDLNFEEFKALNIAPDTKILEKMQAGGVWLNSLLKYVDSHTHMNDKVNIFPTYCMDYILKHTSDTARGWLCYACAEQMSVQMIIAQPILFFKLLEMMKPLAADSHFGVREWAWLAIRPQLITFFQIVFDNHGEEKYLTEQALFWQICHEWANATDENLRRFIIELTRPKGVWCKQFLEICDELNYFSPILIQTAFDDSLYVRKSTANWLNDLSKIKYPKIKKDSKMNSNTSLLKYLHEYQLILNQIQVKIEEAQNSKSLAAKNAAWTLKHAQRSMN